MSTDRWSLPTPPHTWAAMLGRAWSWVVRVIWSSPAAPSTKILEIPSNVSTTPLEDTSTVFGPRWVTEMVSESAVVNSSRVPSVYWRPVSLAMVSSCCVLQKAVRSGSSRMTESATGKFTSLMGLETTTRTKASIRALASKMHTGFGFFFSWVISCWGRSLPSVVFRSIWASAWTPPSAKTPKPGMPMPAPTVTSAWARSSGTSLPWAS